MAGDDEIDIKIGVSGAEAARAQVTSLGDAFAAVHGTLLGGVGAFQSWVVTANQAIGLVQQLVGGFQMLLQPVEQVGQALLNVAQQMDTIVGMSGAITSTLGQAFGQSAFQLNQQTEKNFFNWAYLYGGPHQGGVAIAEQLARWSQQASLYMPFTRQDLMGAITTLAVMPGMTPSKEETDLALLSDVASTQGRQGLTLQWAAMAALRGGEGYGRMLLMDLNLSEATMKKYGYDRKNPSTFFPALQAYEAARQGGHYAPGEIGQAISTETFWGAQTSFVDRIQNTLLQLGGWNNNATTLTGDVRAGSVFGILKKDLVDVSEWMDRHSQQLQQLADIAGNFFGSITGGAGTVFSSFFTALGSSGIGENILTALSDFARFMAQPDTQAGLRSIGEALGGVASSGLKDVFEAGRSFLQGLGASGLGGGMLGNLHDLSTWLSDPERQKQIREFAENVGKLAGEDIPKLTQKIGDLVGQLGELASFFGQVAGIVGKLNDLWQTMGGWSQQLADEFTRLTGIKLADPFQTLKDSIGSMFASLGDFVSLMDDIAHGNWDAAKKDAERLGHDLGQAITAGAPTTSTPPLHPGQNVPGGPVIGPKGGMAPPPPSWPTTQHPIDPNMGGQAAMYAAHYLEVAGYSHISHGAVLSHLLRGLDAGQPILGGGVSTAQGTVAAQQFATAYVTTAQQLMSQHQTSDAIVQPFVTSLRRSITDGSTQLAQTLMQVIDQETRKQIALALAHEDLTGNLGMRGPGGQRFGASIGFQ